MKFLGLSRRPLVWSLILVLFIQGGDQYVGRLIG